jgi:hypothetical protein
MAIVLGQKAAHKRLNDGGPFFPRSRTACPSTLKSVVDAIVARHRDARRQSPLQGHLSYSRLTRCLARVLDRPNNFKQGVTRDMVVALLRSNPVDLVAFRNKNAVKTLTIGCMRPAEGAAALTCELVFDSDYNAGLRQYKLTTKDALPSGASSAKTTKRAKATRCASGCPPTPSSTSSSSSASSWTSPALGPEPTAMADPTSAALSAPHQ